MVRFSRLGKIAGWLASASIVLYALAIAAVTFTYFSPCDAPDWARVIGIWFGYALAAVALNPLSWRFPAFDTVTRRIIFAIAGLALAYALAAWGSAPSHLQGDCSPNSLGALSAHLG